MEIRYIRHGSFVANDLGHELLLYGSDEPRSWSSILRRSSFGYSVAHRTPSPRSLSLSESFDQLEFDTASRDVEHLFQEHRRLFCSTNLPRLNTTSEVEPGSLTCPVRREIQTTPSPIP